jgi:beta-lactam-binding protein with PASTA domain
VIRFFQFVILMLGLSMIALASAIVTMRFAIHGAEVTIPNFRGITAEEALGRSQSLGVEMTIDNRFYSAEVPAGRVLAQSPTAGTVVRREWHVRVTESLGPQLVQIPNLSGQQQRAASMQVRQAGLELGSVAQLPLDGTEPGTGPGTVIAQDPGAGAAGIERPVISIVVSGDNPRVADSFVMPNLIGQPYESAAAILHRAGLKLGPPVGSSHGGASAEMNNRPGVVIEQNPASGYKVSSDAEIVLTVSR